MRLLNLIHHLPGDSFFAEAVSLDEEHVEMILASRQDQDRQAEKYHPRMSEYSPIVARLDQLIDLSQGQIAATVAAAGSKRIPKVHNQPRPETAFETAKHRKRIEASRNIADRFMRRDRPVDSP